MNKIHVGILGLGHMGRLHLMNCLHLDDVKVIAAADKSETSLKRARELGVKNLCNDYRDLLSNSNDLDAVIISLPNFLHFDSINSALEAGLDVFVEKPMATSVDECKRIVKSVEKSSKKFTVGHCMRFLDAISKMKNALDKGYLGNVEVITIEEVYNGPFTHPLVPKPVPEWWFDPKKAGGGVLIDLGYHLIDLFRFFGGDSKILFSYLSYQLNLPVEDGAIIVLRSLHSDAKGIINTGWYQKLTFPKYNFRVILNGNAGYLNSDDLIPKNIYLHAIKEGMKNLLRKIVKKKIRYLSYTYYYEAYYKELRHFFDCIKRDLNPSVTAMDGLKTIQLIEEAYSFYNKNFVLGKD